MYLLHKHQDLMPQMFKMLRGEITPEQFVAEPKKRDRFVEFDQKLLTTYNKEFNDAIDQVYQDYELPNPLRFAYKNNLHSPLKKGDKVVVLWLDYGAWYPATVTSTEFGIKLIYDDGNIMNLLSHQPWRK
jgi:hypothetical protein